MSTQAWVVPFNPNNIHHITLVNVAIADADVDGRGRISAAREALARSGIYLRNPGGNVALEQLVIDLSEWR